MARKIVSRKELRAEAEAAEAAEKAEAAETTEGTTEDVQTGAAAKKKPAKRAARPKAEGAVRMKLFWGVFNQSLRRVALYDFSQKDEADQKAADLSKSGKTPHFVQKVKEVVEE